MKHIRYICFFLCVTFFIVGCGCSEGTVEKENIELHFKSASLESSVVAENGNYMLMWSDSSKSVSLYNKKNGLTYYSTAQEENAPDTAKSPVIISYLDNESNSFREIDGYRGCVTDGNVRAAVCENGIRATYYFEGIQAVIPVEYLLTDDGLQTKILTAKIYEGRQKLYSVSVLPYLVSANNGDGSYLFVPSGSGAIIGARNVPSIENYSEMIYGDDPILVDDFKTKNTNSVRLPVFGAKSNNRSIMATVGKGQETAFIEASRNPESTGFANAYATFKLRSYEVVTYKDSRSFDRTQYKMADSIVNYDYLSVDYIPLEPGSGYCEMAYRYREYLNSYGLLTEETETNIGVVINFLGGTLTSKSFLGIPYKSKTVTTSLGDTLKMAKEIDGYLPENEKSLLILKGYGESGLSPSKIGDGFKISSKNGSEKDLNSLIKYAKSTGNMLTVDIPVLRFSKSNNGYSTMSDAARGPGGLAMNIGTNSITTGMVDKSVSWYMLSRNKLPNAVNDAGKAALKLGFDNISLSDFADTAYSDCRNERTNSRGYMADDVSAALTGLKKQGLNIVSESANLYAAVNSAYITYAPISSSYWSILDEDVPFYQLVFSGKVPMSSVSVNMSQNPKKTYLKAVSLGMALQFSLSAEYSPSLKYSKDTAFISSDYTGIKDTVRGMLEESREIRRLTLGKSIIRYTMDGDLSITEFENGVTLYVNFSDVSKTTPFGEVKPMSFIWNKREEAE